MGIPIILKLPFIPWEKLSFQNRLQKGLIILKHLNLSAALFINLLSGFNEVAWVFRECAS